MTESIVLKRQMAIRGWRAIGQVARAGERKELEPVLLRARETGGTDATDVAEHLLSAPSRKVVAERLLRIGTVLGLLKESRREYALTESGARAIETGKVFVPEYGAWTLWTSEDPLLPSPILRVDAWDETEDAYSETRKDRKDERSFEPLPGWIRDFQGTELTPPASGDGIAVRIEALEDTAEAVDPGGSLSLTWIAQDEQLRLRGNWDGKAVDSRLTTPKIATDQIWEALLDSEGLSENWDRPRRTLRVSFAETNERERESMSRDLEFPEPSVPGYGGFDPVTVSGTDISARSLAEAQRWAVWRLNARIGDFATSERYEAWWDEASAPFFEHGLKRPDRAELAISEWESVTKRPSPRTWHLMAAEDWGL